MTSSNRRPQRDQREPSVRPDWVAKSPKGARREQRLERVGAAWTREDGGICLRLYGTQVISDDVYLFPIADDAGDSRR